MPSFIDAAEDTSFEKVPTDPGVATTQFLAASETLVGLFDHLNPTAFTPVKNDMNGNIKKIRDRQTEAPAVSGTLQELILAEWAEKKKGATATEGLMWLLRGLDFTAKALRHNVDNMSIELVDSFSTAYGETLKPFHNFIVKGIFTVALKATPYRKDFYEKIGAKDATDTRLTGWLEGLERIVGIMQKYYADHPDIKF
ncbi:hypothetical protein Dda_7927 [Drechslerella dactyloides]|uniref:Glycolipid transfer protein domain-containing protein n=1 Tax=Drechslerella dactyloides TaxID=74499 RepID=A0AAD6IR40_DREDA|nr:hypothetical protein Dda_7927 [Drechslerella dactyloides]